MAEITASLVKELREKTGAGMMDCKKALNETGGDLEAAVDWLRTKGLAAAAKKAGRVAAEGLIGIAVAGTKGAVVEVNSETDFVAKNEIFQNFVRAVTEIALEKGTSDIAEIANAAYPGGAGTVAEQLTQNIANIGENQSLRRAGTIEVSQGVVSGYVHGAIAPGIGKIGVLVALESAGDAEKLEALGKQIAMHVAAASPLALDETGIDPETLERERAIAAEKAAASGKPAEIVGKMVEGALRKFKEEVCLVNQVFVIDGKTKISDVIAQAAKDVGAPVVLKGYLRFQLGEGIEKQASDFAAEVAAAAGSN
ncbi:translation elongation factor Ts [Pedomonas mirosovicensis]|uniref:translation elongation factor Ts n=1 Tax=Pedomonas mirosovicensis TaxID=2908641 RepID=UPI0021680965|nr:translation elongation factor Ts [Pedomonas mirosovicensis]MCH8685409.1 translation elongation factor Ts [Pedomonas mirosovicensis]